jgi:hypothetical protein
MSGVAGGRPGSRAPLVRIEPTIGAHSQRLTQGLRCRCTRWCGRARAACDCQAGPAWQWVHVRPAHPTAPVEAFLGRGEGKGKWATVEESAQQSFSHFSFLFLFTFPILFSLNFKFKSQFEFICVTFIPRSTVQYLYEPH